MATPATSSETPNPGPAKNAAEPAPTPATTDNASTLPSLQGVALGWNTAPGDLPRQFDDRRALAAWLRQELLVPVPPTPPSATTASGPDITASTATPAIASAPNAVESSAAAQIGRAHV